MVTQSPLTALLALFVLGCGSQSLGSAVNEKNHDEPVANEAHFELSEAELTDLRQKSEGGDQEALDNLISYYLINYGDEHDEAMYWQLQAARRGDCARWNDLMFMEEDGVRVPARFFSEGETLRSIGEANGCPPYTPRRSRP